MARIKYNKGGFGTRKHDGSWYKGIPIKSVKDFVDEYDEIFSNMRSIDSIKKKYKKIIQELDHKDKKSNARVAGLRISLLNKVDDLSDENEAAEIDKEFQTQIESLPGKFKVTITGERQEPKEKEKESLGKRSRDDQEELQDEDQEDESTKKTTPIEETDVSKKRPREEEKEFEDVEEAEKPTKKAQALDLEEESETIQQDDEMDVEKEDEEQPIDEQPSDQPDETTTEITDTMEEGKEDQPLEELPLTHPNDIVEKEPVFVKDNVEQVVTQDAPTLPEGVTPDGQDGPTPDQGEMTADEFNQQQTELLEQQQKDEKELPSYEEMVEDYKDVIEQEIQEEEIPPHSYLGFDNNDHPIEILLKPTQVEAQDLMMTAINRVVKDAMDVEEGGNIDALVEETVQQIFSGEIDTVEEEKEEEKKEQQTLDEASIQAQPPTEMEVEMAQEEETKQQEPTDVDVEMKEPSKDQVKQQDKERQMIGQEEIKRKKQQDAMDKLHSEIFGQRAEPIVTEEEESRAYKKLPKSQKVLQYISSIVLQQVDDLINQKKVFSSQIKNGSIVSDFVLRAQDKSLRGKQKEIVKEAKQQAIKDVIRKAINEKMILRSADITAEVADYTAKNIEKIKQNLDPRFAISKYIYPTFRDPDTFNVVKYRSDADGNVIINKQTGQPIIESISAVDRDDTRRLLEQRQAVDATDTPSPYFPMYGKQARRYFSKLEYNYLGRMFQGPGGSHRMSIPRPTNIKSRVDTMLKEMGSSLELKDTSINQKQLFKQWMELEVLKNAYQRYNQYSDYQYIQDKKELGQDGTLIDPDATESAAKLLQNVTVQKLLDLLSQQKRQEIQVGKTVGEENNLPTSTIQSLSDKQQQEISAQPDQMDVDIDPTKIGGEGPEQAIDRAQQEQEETKQETDLGAWAKKSTNDFAPTFPKIYRYDSFPAFGGDKNKLEDL